MSRIAIAIALAALSACATAGPVQPGPVTASDQTIGSAAAQPLRDLNLKHPEIPPVLADAAAAPYAPPATRDCPTAAKEIAALDLVLGLDLDALAKTPTGAAKDNSFAADIVVDAVRSAAGGWIPVRGVVRRVTGAEQQARLLRQAILAGEIRRAYLKGLGESLGCPPPAAPVR